MFRGSETDVVARYIAAADTYTSTILCALQRLSVLDATLVEACLLEAAAVGDFDSRDDQGQLFLSVSTLRSFQALGCGNCTTAACSLLLTEST